MRLLQRTIRQYSILSFFVLLIGIPVFYFVLQAVVKEEVDEDLAINKYQVVKRLNLLPADTVLTQFNYLDRDLVITRSRETNEYDSFSTMQVYDSLLYETVSERTLKTNVIVHGNPYLIQIRITMVDHKNLIETVLLVQVILLALLFAGLWIINKNVSSAYLTQKEFTENAAHEMQTPLAVFQSKLELLMQTSPITSTQADLISKMADAGQRMNKLNKALVMLTRIQNHQFTDREKVDLEAVINNILNQYEDAITQKEITVSVKKISSAKIETNKTLIEVLAGNLLSNAIRHNRRGGFINISLNEKELVMENSGPAKALNTTKIFQRFQKETEDRTGLGLGLEIIDKICSLNHYSLKYHYQLEKHSFTIKF